MRRLWPELMISWNRLFQGRFRDPLIGRDILIGAVVGTVAILLFDLSKVLPKWLGLPFSPGFEDIESLSGVRQVLARCVFWPMTLTWPLIVLLLLLLLRTVLRRQWAAVSVLFLLMGTTMAGMPSVIDALIGMILLGLSIFVLLRHGLVAAMAMSLFEQPRFGVSTTDLSSWYAGQMMIPLLLLTAIAAYAFYVSLAGRPLFGAELFDEGGAMV